MSPATLSPRRSPGGPARRQARDAGARASSARHPCADGDRVHLHRCIALVAHPDIPGARVGRVGQHQPGVIPAHAGVQSAADGALAGGAAAEQLPVCQGGPGCGGVRELEAAQARWALRARIALRPSRAGVALVALVALRPLHAGVALRALCAGVALGPRRAGRADRARVALGTLRARVTLGGRGARLALRAGWAPLTGGAERTRHSGWALRPARARRAGRTALATFDGL